MSLRLTVDLFKGQDHDTFLGELGGAAKQLRKKFELRLESRGDIHSVGFFSHGNFPLCQAVGEATGLPWIEIRLQEEALWDYSLFEGGRSVDEFSTLPEYWEDPEDCTPAQWKKYLDDRVGNPALLARLWQLPQERIERYVRQWGWVHDPDDADAMRHVLKGKAYSSDAHSYGQCRQMFDFYRVLFPDSSPGGSETKIVERVVL